MTPAELAKFLKDDQRGYYLSLATRLEDRAVIAEQWGKGDEAEGLRQAADNFRQHAKTFRQEPT